MLMKLLSPKQSFSSPVLFYSSYAMSNTIDTITFPTQSSNEQAEERQIASNINLSVLPGADAVRTPRRIAVECIWKHLGFKGYSSDTGGITSIKNRSSSEGINNNTPVINKVQQAGAFTSKMSVTCLNQSDRGIECSSSCVSSENTLGTRHQCNHSGVQDQLSTDSIQQDDEVLHDTDCLTLLKENSLPTSFGKQYHPQSRKPKPNQRGLEHGTGSRNQNLKNRKRHTTIEPFDICYSENEESPVCQSESDSEDFVFGRSSEEEDDDVDVEDNSQEDRPSEECRHRVLRPGMVLLKKYISRTEQISIVRKCRQLGLGRGGFHRPGYNDGAKLRLHMMCLGMDWDPQTRKYQKQRRIDRAKPPDIPSEFHLLVNRAMQYSLALTRTHYKVTHAEEILPQVTPDVCIVNFYNETGRLGLHQDRDESTESLSKRLPVVSFSVGNAAEFLYGDQRDVNKANKLVLESGDVLVFGGESRHIFHGITSIIPDSAPGFLQKEIKLCPGRLNLTFRKY